MEVPGNGRLPESSSNIRTPKLNTSERAVAAPSLICSGLA